MDQASARPRASWLVQLTAFLFALSALLLVFKDDSPEHQWTSGESDPKLAALTESNTKTTLRDAPSDPRPDRVPKGTVVHPKKMTAVYDAPDGEPFAKIGPRQFGDTWLPVITRNRSWVQVLLPSRPNGSTGWLRASELTEARSRFLVQVHLGQRTIQLYEDNDLVGTWPVAIGKPDTPTPTGRTFLLGQFTDPNQSFSPVILPLGTHSATLDSYGGGPGTVAIHGWQDDSVFGKAVSHGCIRVPDDALALLRTVPTGTPVLIDES